MRKTIILSAICSLAMALEFGGFGSVSTSMGYAGVALKDGDFPLYYNPALLSYTREKFSFNLGVGFSQKNLLELTSVDKNTNKKLETKLQDISKIFEGGNNFGNFSSVVDDFIANNKTNTNSDLQALAISLETKASLTITIDKVKDDLKLSELIKQELLTSIENASNDLTLKGVDVNLVKSLISNVDVNGILNVIDASKNGSIDLSEVANHIGDVKLSSFLDAKSMDDIDAVYDAVYDNEINVFVSSGIESDISLGDDGALAFGVYGKVLANTFASLNSIKNQLIVKVKDKNQINDTYLKIFKKNGEIYVSSATKDEYDNFSAFSKGTKNPLTAKSLILTEVPIGYANIIEMPYGELSVGGSIKYINAIGYHIDKGIEISLDGANSDDINFKDELKNPSTTNTFALDLGVLYSIDDFSTGLVVKNINNPEIKFQGNNNIRLHPQVRGGFAYKLGFATFVLDLDLLPNKTLSYKNPKSQVLGGGAKFDFANWFDFRLGMAYDFKKDDKAIVTGGFGLFDIFDLSVASSLKTSKCSSDVCGSSMNIPKYFDLRLNVGYRW